MPRPKKKRTLVTPAWEAALKTKFLDYSFRLYPLPLQELFLQVAAKKLTLREWAQSWQVSGTWIEKWASDTLKDWSKSPPVPDGGINYYGPSARETEGFSFKIENEHPDCRIAFGLTVGGKPFDDEPQDDWERFRGNMHKRLDFALEQFHRTALVAGSFNELDVDSDPDLDLKIATAAMNVFGQLSAGRIAPQVRYERSTVTRWLDKILDHLDLGPAKRGPGRKPKCAANPRFPS